MNIREFERDDIKRVHEIEAMSFPVSYGVDMIIKLFDIGTGFLIAEDNDYVIGYIIFWIKVENQGHIISIAVDKNYRNNGVGTKLLFEAVSIFKRCNLKQVNLEVNANHKKVIKFYKNFGFKIDREVPHYYENDESAYVMFYPLE